MFTNNAKYFASRNSVIDSLLFLFFYTIFMECQYTSFSGRSRVQLRTTNRESRLAIWGFEPFPTFRPRCSHNDIWTTVDRNVVQQSPLVLRASLQFNSHNRRSTTCKVAFTGCFLQNWRKTVCTGALSFYPCVFTHHRSDLDEGSVEM